jgi:hypothetical protein
MTASRLKIVAERRHGLSRAVTLRRSVRNQQNFDSSSEALWSPQPPRHLGSGIRLTEQTACCPPAPSDSSSLTGGCDRSSQNQEQCTTYTRSGLAWLLTRLLSVSWRGRNDDPERNGPVAAWHHAPGPLYPLACGPRAQGRCSISNARNRE